LDEFWIWRLICFLQLGFGFEWGFVFMCTTWI